ncbi:MAG: S-methyl-5-thioribose-1-phosphate isomerase [Thermoleophilia bacterium]
MSGAPPGLAPRDIIRLTAEAVEMLDQTRLPGESVTVSLADWPEVVEAIRGMVVRGAPAIGIAGAMGVALAALRSAPRGDADQRAEVARAAAALRAARPTAVNLAREVDRQAARAAAHPGPPQARAAALAGAARRLHEAEVDRCERMGRHALALVTRGARILTHCNAGALATGGYGTALGVVRAAHAADPTVRVVVDETRPLLQGARLTAWELEREGIPYTLIADSMAAAMMAAGAVSHVVVGADRIAANGDVVNKIGTYGLAVIAREHGIPVIVAAPTTTIDPATPTGADVEVEERAADEVRGLSLFGRGAAPPAAPVANPAFDRTPARLVAAIVTEQGVHRPPYERSLAAAVAAGRAEEEGEGDVPSGGAPP